MVDEKKIALSPAYQLAALTPKEQGLLLETIDSEQTTPSLSQAQRMKKLSQSGELNEDTMLSIILGSPARFSTLWSMCRTLSGDMGPPVGDGNTHSLLPVFLLCCIRMSIG